MILAEWKKTPMYQADLDEDSFDSGLQPFYYAVGRLAGSLKRVASGTKVDPNGVMDEVEFTEQRMSSTARASMAPFLKDAAILDGALQRSQKTVNPILDPFSPMRIVNVFV